MMRAPCSCENLVIAYTQSLYNKDIGNLLVRTLLLLVHECKGFLARRGFGRRGTGYATGLGAPIMDVDEAVVNLYGFITKVVEKH